MGPRDCSKLPSTTRLFVNLTWHLVSFSQDNDKLLHFKYRNRYLEIAFCLFGSSLPTQENKDKKLRDFILRLSNTDLFIDHRF